MTNREITTTPLVHRKESTSVAHHGRSVLVSIAQIMALGMVAFVMGAMIPIFTHFHNSRSGVATVDGVSTTTHASINNNLRQKYKTKDDNSPKIAWRKCGTQAVIHYPGLQPCTCPSFIHDHSHDKFPLLECVQSCPFQIPEHPLLSIW